MGYSCNSTACRFYIDNHYLGDVLVALAPTEHVPTSVDEVTLLNVAKTGNLDDMCKMLSRCFEEKGYDDVLFDDNGNVVNAGYKNGNWIDDTDFFNVFAKYVQKGSFIEYRSEDGTYWRVCFDGERCFEVNPVILWPNYAPVVIQEKFDKAKQCLVDNGIEYDEADTVLQALSYIMLDEETEQFFAEENVLDDTSLDGVIKNCDEIRDNQGVLNEKVKSSIERE